MRSEDQSPYWKFRRVSAALFKTGYAFLALFTGALLVVLPAIGMGTGILDPATALIEMLLGAAIIAVLAVCYGLAHTRIGALMTLVALAYWWKYVADGIIDEYQYIDNGYGTAWAMMGLPWLYFVAMALLGLLNFIGETVNLGITKRSWSLGPWFHGIFYGLGLVKERLDKKQKRAIVKTCLALGIIAGLVVPSILALTGKLTFPIEIRPRPYEITYNFWATPDINGTYTSTWATQYNIGPEYYSNASLDQFEKHHVNLDLTFNIIDNGSLATLMKWEQRCPSITYRITMYPVYGNLALIEAQVVNATTLLMAWEAAGNITAWKGFAFDIEGEPFTWWSGFATYEEARAMWTRIFDFIDLKSTELGRRIDMECISDTWTSVDVPFDGDEDIQRSRTGFNAYSPERFDVYAPMIYRCWYKGDKPWGSPAPADDPWPTSYEVYSSLKLLQGAVPDEKLGFYIGISNCSCYGRDLPQEEAYTWPVGIANTGFYNMMRDVLIAKHFGVKEITFFLAWTWFENDYSMGGVFESYGPDFLDRVNETVNINPPDSLQIYYVQGDSETSERFRLDWYLNFNRVDGILQMVTFWAASASIVLLFPAFSRKLRAGRTRERKAVST
jgi:hypothetical protein